MKEEVFLILNSWGVIFYVLVTIYFIFSIYLALKFGGTTPLRKYIAIIPLISVPATFVLNGFVAGILILPVGLILGVSIAKIIFRSNSNYEYF